MRKFVIDTSLFVNPASRISFGKDPKSAVKGFIKKVKNKNAEFFMPPSIFAELTNFVGTEIEKLELVVKKRSPNMYSMYLPAAIVYSFIEDIRRRLNKGLRLAEEFAVDNTAENDPKLQRLRQKYRESMRTGLVDSTEDFELILLAKDLEATLVSGDEGVLKFASQIGCEILNATKFAGLIKTLK